LKGALEGIRVLDFSAFAAGPYCAMLMGDMGAEVIRVESPAGGIDRKVGQLDSKGESLVFKTTARNKKGITLDIREPESDDMIMHLVSNSDVVIHNALTGTRSGKKLAYSRLKKHNPRIIVGIVSGYGPSGPDAELPCLDPVAQAYSGQMWIQGFRGHPPLQAGPRYVDFCTGANLAFAIMVALYHRERTGVGQMIDIALSDMAVALVQQTSALLLYMMNGELRHQVGNYGFSSYMDCCLSKDEQWVYMAPLADNQWRKFVEAIGRSDMASDPRFSSDMLRWHHRDIIHEIVSEWVASRTAVDVIQKLERARVVVGKVNTVAEMVQDPRLEQREMIVYLEHPGLGQIPIPGIVPKLSETPGKVEKRAPTVGEHNENIYRGLLGLSERVFLEAKNKGVI